MPAESHRPRSRRGSGLGEGFDRPIETAFWSRKKVLVGALLIGSLCLFAFATKALLTKSREQSVERSKVTVAQVQRGIMQESISAAGELLPRTTVYLDSVEGGRIEEIFVLEGSLVEQGMPLLRLSNNELQLRLINLNGQKLDQMNRLRDARYRAEQQGLELRRNLAEIEHQIKTLERRVARNVRLRESQLISDEESELAKDELDYLRRQQRMTQETHDRSAEFQRQQLRQLELDARAMESSYDIVRSLMDNLIIRAPIAGQVTALETELGKLIAKGARLGKIDNVSDGFKIRAEVDEFYLEPVQVGQLGTTLPVGGRAFEITVARVYPEVEEGKFAVDLEFLETPDKGLHRGQTLGFQLRLGEPYEALLLHRGSFYQHTGGRWVYTLIDDHTAERRPIQLGRVAADKVEVVAGLELDDQVIISSYETFGDAQRLVLH